MAMTLRLTNKRLIRYYESVFTHLVVGMLIAKCLLLSAVRATDISFLPTILSFPQYNLYVTMHISSPS